MTAKENLMKNYLDEIYTLSEFKRDNPALAGKAEQALQYIKGYYPKDNVFVVIEVEGYNCVACLCDDFSPYVLGATIAPFDENQIYPVQGLTTKYAFQR